MKSGCITHVEIGHKEYRLSSAFNGEHRKTYKVHAPCDLQVQITFIAGYSRHHPPKKCKYNPLLWVINTDHLILPVEI